MKEAPKALGPMILSVLAVLAVACAPSAPTTSVRPEAGPSTSAGAPEVGGRVTIASGIDPPNLASKLSEPTTYSAEYQFLVNSPLVVIDGTGAPRPLLAAEQPSRDRGTWTVNPDGTMATTWKIRPNAVWHDGQPITSRDFALALRVYLDDGIKVPSRLPERFMDRIEPLDEKTFVIRWRQTYPWANQLLLGQLEPLPEHLVGALYESGDKAAFENAPIWTGPAYVGSGPFRLTQWEKGVHLVFKAFDQYFMGAPKLDEVEIRVITDANTLAANALSGSVDVTAGLVLTQAPRLAVQQQWDRSSEGTIVSYPTHHRMHFLQLEPSRNRQPALFDVRVRRALAQGMDRATIADVVSEGTTALSEVLMSPNDALYQRVEQATARYPFDRTRAFAALQDAGWTRVGETLANARGEPFTLDVSGSQQVDNATEMNLVEASLRELGVQVTQSPIPQARAFDREYRAQFAGLSLSGMLIDIPTELATLTTGECPSAENRFSGKNRGCYSNPEFDRLFAIATSSLDDRERGDAIVQAFRIITEEVPIIGMGYHHENVAVRKGLVGPAARWPGQRGTTWNVYEWRWAS